MFHPEPLAALEALLSKVAQERDEYRKLVLHLREENERHKRRQPAAPRPSGHGRVMQMARALAA